MSAAKESNDSFVKRNAMSSEAEDGKKFFRTSLFGYNKIAVNDYIDRLYSEYSEGEKALVAEVNKLRKINEDLQERNKKYDSEFQSVREQVTTELAFVSQYRDIEKEYSTTIEDLQKARDTLEEKVKAGDELNTSLLSRLEESINRADELQRTIDRQNEELSRLSSGKTDDSISMFTINENELGVSSDSAQDKDPGPASSAESEETIRKLTEDVSSFERRLSEAEKERDSALSALQAAADQIRQMRNELNKRISQLISQRDTDIARNNERMLAQYEKRISEHERRYSELKRENSRLSGEISEIIRKRDNAIASNNEKMQAHFDKMLSQYQAEAAELKRSNSNLSKETEGLTRDLQQKNSELEERVADLSKEKEDAIRHYNAVLQNGQNQIQKLQKEFQSRMQNVQNIVTSMQTQNTKLQQSLNEKNNQLKEIIGRYNSAVEVLNKRQSIIQDMSSKLSEENQKQMEREFRINSLNSEMVRRDISLSQKDNEILALRNYISELEGRLGYAVGYQNGHKSSFEVAYRNDSQNQEQAAGDSSQIE